MERSKFPFLQDHSTVLAYNKCVLKLKLSYHNLNHVRKEILTKALTENSAHTQIEDAIRAILYNLEREFDLVTIQTENFVIHPEECSWPLVSSQKLSHLVIKGKNYRFHPNLILLNIYCKDPIVVSKQISKEKNDILNKILIKDNRTNKNTALLPERSNISHNKPQSSDVTNDLNCGSKINTLILATPRLATNDVGSQSPRKHNKIVELLHKHDSSAVQKSHSTDNGMNIASSSKKLRGTNYKSKLHLSSTKNKQRVSSPKKICTKNLSTEQSVDFETDETNSKGSSMKSIPLKRKSKEENGKSIKTKLDHSPVKKRKVTKSDYSVPVDTNDINYNISQENDDNIIICPEKRYDISEANITNVKPQLRSVANKNLKTSSYNISELNDKQRNNEDKFIRDVNKEKKNHYNLSEPIFQSSSKKMSKNCVIEISRDGSIIEEAESTERCKGLSNETQLNGGSDVKRNDSEYEDKKNTTSTGAATNSRNRKKKVDKETNHAHSNNVLNSETQAKETRNTVHNSTIETRSKKTLPSKIRTNARKINKANIVHGSLSDISSSSMSSDTETKKHGIKSNVFKQAESSNRPHTRSTSRESSRQTRSSSSLSTRSGQRHTGMSSNQSAPKAENHYPKVSVWLSKKANIPN